jgi:hypothetical protein
MLRVLILYSFILVSCSQSAENPTDEEKRIIIRDVKQMLHHYCTDIGKTGLEAEFNYLDSSSDFSWVPPGFSSAISFDSVAFILRKNAGLFRSVNNQFDSLKIVPLGKHLASYTANINSTSIDTAGKEYVSSLVETGIVIKRAGGWKLLKGQTSIRVR